MIYLDNSATSWPKPRATAQAMTHFLEHVGANPGRSGHRLSIEAGRVVYRARESIASLFNLPDPLRVVFGLNGTEAINLALRGVLKPGDHVVTSSMEHNSVMRPLRDLEKTGVEVTVVRCAADGGLAPEDLERSIRKNTALMVLNHGSNVTGSLLPVAAAGGIARQHGILLLVDAAQTAGSCPIDMEEDRIDLLAFTGHKGLLGPTGTGGLVIGERVNVKEIRPLKSGGTGSRSEHETQPDFLPDVFESGTPNAVGLAGLDAGVRFVLEQGVERIREHEVGLARRLLEGLREIHRVVIHGEQRGTKRTATLSFTVDGVPCSEVGLRLDEEHGILCRVGLHCAPAAHRTIGTFPTGTVRLSPGFFNTSEEMDRTVAAVGRIAASGGR